MTRMEILVGKGKEILIHTERARKRKKGAGKHIPSGTSKMLCDTKVDRERMRKWEDGKERQRQ